MIEIVTSLDSGDEGEKHYQAFKKRLFRASEDSIEWATAPLVHFKDGKALEHRTGIFIAIDQMRFLVTASHGLQKHDEEGRSLEIVMPVKGRDTIPLSRERFWTTINQNEDLTVTRLTDETVATIGNEYRYMRLTDMMSMHDRQHEDGLYLLMGFPFAMIGPDDTGVKRADTWKYLTTRYHGDMKNVENYVPDIHLILDYERRTYNREGRTVHPDGLSGCGIWFVGNPISHALFKADDFKLVGIQTAWHKNHEYAKGTWTDNVLHIIWKFYSDARAPMRLQGIQF